MAKQDTFPDFQFSTLPELLDKDNEDTFLHISTLPVLTDKDSGETFPHFHTSRVIR